MQITPRTAGSKLLSTRPTSAQWSLSRFFQSSNGRMAEYASSKWWDASTVAIVTGSNKGIGFEIARELHKQGLTVVCTARNPELGMRAVEQIVSAQGDGQVLFQTLDISQPSSIASFASWVKKEFPNGVDVLVNNAGMAYKGDTFGPEEARTTLDTNFYGTMNLVDAMESCIKSNTGRVVNVSSRAGVTRIVPDQKLKEKIVSADKQELSELGAKFVKDIESGEYQKEGWPKSMYGISKLLLSMYTRQAAKQLEPRGIMVNACCPGWCQTDMSSGRGPNTALQGADTPLWLALRPPSEFVTGKFFGERHEVDT